MTAEEGSVPSHESGLPVTSWWWWPAFAGAFLGAGLATSFVPFVGLVIFMVAAAVTLAMSRFERQPGVRALAFALASNAFVLGHSLWLFTFTGPSIRPMIWNGEVLLVGLGCVLCVGVLALRSMWSERRFLVPGVAFVAAMESLLLGWQILALASRVRGFQLAD